MAPAERRDRLQADQPDGPHRGGPHDARLGPGEHDETGEREEGQRRSPATRDAQDDAQPEHQADTTATLLPLTAVRCVMPVARIAAVRSGGVRLVSPMTSPGRRPRGRRPARRSTADRRPARSRSAAAATAPGGASTPRRAADRQRRDAVVTRSVGPSRPRTRTVDRQAGRRSPGIAGEQHRRARAAPQTARVETEHGRFAQHAGRSPRPGSMIGSLVTTARP